MHELLIAAVVKTCRQRNEEGECPSVVGFDNAVLEEVIIDLANQLDSLKRPLKEKLPLVYLI